MSRRYARLLCEGNEFPFVDRLEIGRESQGRLTRQGRIELDDPTVSGRHCVVTQDSGGHFFVRDLSRNGTRLDSKRLIPNLESEIEPEQTLAIGPFTLTLAADEEVGEEPVPDTSQTVMASGLVFVTLVVADIRAYTSLNQREDAATIARSVRRVFSELEAVIKENDGSIKEYQGDAVMAFWEADRERPGLHAAQAMDAGLALDQRARDLAADPEVWPFPDFPLAMELGLSTGAVVISSLGRERPTGLSMVGDAVNMAYRIEKLVTDDNGPILVCETTHRLGEDLFEFADQGEVTLRGRRGKERIFTLRSRRP